MNIPSQRGELFFQIFISNKYVKSDENDLVSEEQNLILDADFSEKEVKEAVFGSYADGAPGPDGFHFLFYQKFWELIKSDLMGMVNE
jgi:hypothetical protein